ncbi:hypothetical protein QPK06_11550 [Aeromonas veronii]|uniref:hypothetical protein n=1 Tax=Aeromonas veronii TaxID=654 RepID=UPI0011193E33|nr:hypothetical protein [Aeromonas veronii]MCX0422295.1 hypothetical protein [Aeromonas veronii]WIJ39744.1 hypothetical protein QPK06_11550 [Aeromonas veronii]
MAREFSRSIKGSLTEQVFQCLLEDVGYRVIQIGIEESIKEIKAVSESNPNLYHKTHKGLRTLPDFLVMDEQENSSFLVEIKFRASHEDLPRLICSVKEQVLHWGDIFLVAFIGNPYHTQKDKKNNIHPDETPTNYCRVFSLTKDNSGNNFHVKEYNNQKEKYTGNYISPEKCRWLHGANIQQTFPRLRNAEDLTVAKSVEIITSMYATFK